MRDDAMLFEAAGQAVKNELHTRVWPVGALVKAVGDALQARFAALQVEGEISGFSRAASGHCYFNLKDEAGQLRCAMFRRAALGMNTPLRDGDQVRVQGRLAVYEPRGDLQFIVESVQRAGQGALFEQFLRLKAQLEAEGLFDAQRKRPIPLAPRGIGLVTSLQAAAFADVSTALARRVPHIPVWVSPASVQGANAPSELIEALQKLYLLPQVLRAFSGDLPSEKPMIDVILLVRGGGSMEDLWAFNDERLARCIADSPVPIISGVGHETDFSIADFVADLRAPTPTAAAELAATERSAWLGAADLMQERLQDSVLSQIDAHAQRLDHDAQRLARPSETVSQHRLNLQGLEHIWQRKMLLKNELLSHNLRAKSHDFYMNFETFFTRSRQQLAQHEQALEHLNPQRVLERGFALLQGKSGEIISRAKDAQTGDHLLARLGDGQIDLKVIERPAQPTS